MSAPNFHKTGARSYFVVESDDTEYWEYTVENLTEEIKNQTSKFDLDFSSKGRDEKEIRSYPSRVLGLLTHTKITPTGSYNIEFTVTLRSGYYMHANIDYYWKIFKNGQEQENWDFIGGKGLRKEFDLLRDKIERVFKSLSTEYKCLAVASNGEAFYEKVN